MVKGNIPLANERTENADREIENMEMTKWKNVELINKIPVIINSPEELTCRLDITDKRAVNLKIDQ